MKKSELRRVEIVQELKRRASDPGDALYGFLVQGERNKRFDASDRQNESARELFRRLAKKAEYEEAASRILAMDGEARYALQHLRQDLADAILAAKWRRRRLQSELARLPVAVVAAA